MARWGQPQTELQQLQQKYAQLQQYTHDLSTVYAQCRKASGQAVIYPQMVRGLGATLPGVPEPPPPPYFTARRVLDYVVPIGAGGATYALMKANKVSTGASVGTALGVAVLATVVRSFATFS